jgi:hypothetical protein
MSAKQERSRQASPLPQPAQPVPAQPLPALQDRRTPILAAVIGAIGAILGALSPSIFQSIFPQHILIQGAIMRSDAKPSNRSVIKDVEVDYQEDGIEKHAMTNQSGGFNILLGSKLKAGDLLTLRFHKHCYQDFSDTISVAAVPYPRYLWPELDQNCIDPAITALSLEFRNVGIMQATLQITTRGSVPCQKSPCSPDNKWQAAQGSVSLDAGGDNSFSGGTFGCVAGPCPFSEIVADNFSKGGTRISGEAKTWSDDVTYVLKGTLSGPGQRSLSKRLVTFDNNSCEERKYVHTTYDYSNEISRDWHLVRVDQSNRIAVNQSAINISFTGTQVVVFGWLDTATCIKLPFGNWTLIHSASLRSTLVPIAGGPPLGPTSALPPLRIYGDLFDFAAADNDMAYLQIAMVVEGRSVVEDVGAVSGWQWATCQKNAISRQSTAITEFHCSLNPNYRFNLTAHP